MTDGPYCATCARTAHPGECYPELRADEMAGVGHLRALLREGSVLMYEDPNLAWGRQNNWHNRVADVLAQPEPVADGLPAEVEQWAMDGEPVQPSAWPEKPEDWPTYTAGLAQPWSEEDAVHDLQFKGWGPSDRMGDINAEALGLCWGWPAEKVDLFWASVQLLCLQADVTTLRELWASGAWRE